MVSNEECKNFGPRPLLLLKNQFENQLKRFRKVHKLGLISYILALNENINFFQF